MPAYSFQKQFVPFIESGAKTHTIRGKRKVRPQPGQTFYGYYAMRTKQCRKLIQGTITRVQSIVIRNGPTNFVERLYVIENGNRAFGPYPEIEIDGELLADDEMEALAKRDGFPNLFRMIQFWDGRLPFEGDIIHWKPVAK